MDQALRSRCERFLANRGHPEKGLSVGESLPSRRVCRHPHPEKTRRQRWTASTTAGTCSGPARASFQLPGDRPGGNDHPPVPGAGPPGETGPGAAPLRCLEGPLPPLPVPPPGRLASGRPGGRAPVRGVCRPHPGHLQRHEGGALLPHRGGGQRVCGPCWPSPPRPVEELIAETEACYDRLKHRPFGTGQFTQTLSHVLALGEGAPRRSATGPWPSTMP